MSNASVAEQVEYHLRSSASSPEYCAGIVRKVACLEQALNKIALHDGKLDHLAADMYQLWAREAIAAAQEEQEDE